MNKKLLIGVDPGTFQSAFVIWDGKNICEKGILGNEELKSMIKVSWRFHLVIEMIESYGMPVGESTFQTVMWIGRFVEVSKSFDLVSRKDIKMHLCNSMRAKDANIRQAIMDRFDPSGGGSNPVVGTKKNRGPLYGVKSHIWSALAVALFYSDKRPQVHC